MQESKIGYLFIVMASVVIILAGVKSASAILVPFLLSLFIAIILSPLYHYFKSKKVPEGLALVLVMSMFLVILGLVGKLIGTSVSDFSANIDVYSSKLASYHNNVSDYALSLGVTLPVDDFTNLFNSKRIMTFGTTILQGMSSMLTNGFVIILTVVFMLLESGHFIDKIDFADKQNDTTRHIKMISSKIKHYMVLKALISMLTGFIVWIFLLIIGTDYAFLWAVLAFMFNFIPNIGSIIAAVPAVLITLVQLGSLNALIVSIFYVSINVIIGSIIEPRVMGKGLGLSTLVVFLSLLFWGWLLGIVGMLLSIPLTIMAKIVFDANENTRWVAVLLGTGENLKSS
ncbi:AI-2E family transporter [Sulfurimonas sp. SAG-AH-194-C20]|nr:AI-2E family transporter [Sulfurimonas sp. SAG-AH-194-C20]MDF1879297.1 AI-2E family transporter [Sulfurimonas sp. SAG-AH-194-C20]